MNKIIVKNPPSACEYCWALDEYGDYPMCRITGETRGYNFDKFAQRMERCPFISLDESVINVIDKNYNFVCSCMESSFYSDYIKDELKNFCIKLVNDIRKNCTEN